MLTPDPAPTVFEPVLALIVTAGPLFAEGVGPVDTNGAREHVATWPWLPLLAVQVGVAWALSMAQEAGVLPLPAVPVIEHEYVPPDSAVPVPGNEPEPVNWMVCVPFVALLAGGTPTLRVLIGGAVYWIEPGKAPPQFSVEPLCEHCASAVVGDATSA